MGFEISWDIFLNQPGERCWTLGSLFPSPVSFQFPKTFSVSSSTRWASFSIKSRIWRKLRGLDYITWTSIENRKKIKMLKNTYDFNYLFFKQKISLSKKLKWKGMCTSVTYIALKICQLNNWEEALATRSLSFQKFHKQRNEINWDVLFTFYSNDFNNAGC